MYTKKRDSVKWHVSFTLDPSLLKGIILHDRLGIFFLQNVFDSQGIKHKQNSLIKGDALRTGYTKDINLWPRILFSSVKHCILKELECKACTASFNSRIQDQECLLRGEPAKKVPTSGWCEKKAFVTSSSHLCIIVRTFANEKMLLFTWNHVSPGVLSWLIIHLKVESCGLSCASAWDVNGQMLSWFLYYYNCIVFWDGGHGPISQLPFSSLDQYFDNMFSH